MSPGFGFILVRLGRLGETGRGTDEDWFPLHMPLSSQSGPQCPEKHLAIDSCAGELPTTQETAGSVHSDVASQFVML